MVTTSPNETSKCRKIIIRVPFEKTKLLSGQPNRIMGDYTESCEITLLDLEVKKCKFALAPASFLRDTTIVSLDASRLRILMENELRNEKRSRSQAKPINHYKAVHT